MATTAPDTPAATAAEIVLVAAVALVDRDSRVLLARRPEGKPMAGLWEFPGGKLLPGETPEAALIRELDEELGIDTVESCLAPIAFASHAYETFHLLMPLFVCRVWSGTPQPREGQLGLGPALAPHQLVPLVHHDRVHAGELLPGVRVGEQDRQRLRGREQHRRELLAQLLLPVR